MDDWYDDYKAYKAWLEAGGVEPEQDNECSDWEQCMAQEALTDQELNLIDDYWTEYANGERASYETTLQILYGG